MTLPSTTIKQLFQGDGATVTFAIPFAITYPSFKNSDVVVILRDYTNPLAVTETAWVNPTNYSISGTNVVAVTAPTATQKLLVKRIRPLTQTTSYLTSGAFPAKTNEDNLDQLTMEIQQLSEILNRIPQIDQTFGGPTPVMPEPAAGNVLGWDNAGVNLMNVPVVPMQNAYRAGSTGIGSGASLLAVTFSAPMPSTAYAVICNHSNIVDASPDFQPITITTKTTNGFTAKWNDPTPTANYGLEWTAIGSA